jgi:hypothetical protein
LVVVIALFFAVTLVFLVVFLIVLLLVRFLSKTEIPNRQEIIGGYKNSVHAQWYAWRDEFIEQARIEENISPLFGPGCSLEPV